MWVLEAGLEPAQPLWPKDFKSFVSTIPPFEHGRPPGREAVFHGAKVRRTTLNPKLFGCF